MAFIIYQKGRGGYRKELARSEFLDIAEHCTKGICESIWPTTNQYLGGFREIGESFVEVQDEEGKVHATLVLRQSKKLQWVVER